LVWEVDLGQSPTAHLVPCSSWRFTGTWLVSVMKIEWLALLKRLGFDRLRSGQPQ